MRPGQRVMALAVAAASVLGATGCGGGGPAGRPAAAPVSAGAGASTASGSTTSAPTVAPTTATARPTTARPVSRSVTARRTPAPRRTTTTAVSSKPRCTVPSGVSATRVVVVRSSGAGATIRACRRESGHYVTDLGPYSGHVGKNGVTSSKREGDLKTPVGVFPLRNGFGVRADPGLVGPWLRVDSHDVWVDDSSSSLYNTHQRTPADGRWSSAEPMLQEPAYDYAQVIGYNEARTPGRGSAIFLHVDLGHGTAGCVSLPRSALLSVMRWEHSGTVIAIR